MKIKKFVGQSFKEALETVKRELGPDAIILSSKSVKTGPFGIFNKDAVEVTATIDDTNNMPLPPETASIALEEILKEIRGLKDEIGFLKEIWRPIVPTLRIGKDKKGLFNLLIKQGVDTQFAMLLLERSEESLDSLKSVIKKDLKIQGLLPAEDSGLMFLGPPGAGKTTTMSKIAYLLALKQRKHVNLISLDCTRIGSIAYMKELSKQLRCSLKVIKKVSDLPKIVYKDIAKGPILIDTPGYEYKEILQDIKDIFPTGFPVKKCFLVDATMDTQAALKAWQNCNCDSDSIGFTKLDMATQYGMLYNISLLTGRPLSFLATGPDIPDDIRIPTSEFLSGLIIGGV